VLLLIACGHNYICDICVMTYAREI